MFLPKTSLLPLLLLVSSSSSSLVNAESDSPSEKDQAYTIVSDNIHSYSAMSVGTYSLPALPYAYDVRSPPILKP
jgi:superoxide dismutase, Fe-Mn family